MSMKYKKTESITLSVKGFIDKENMTIDVDGDIKKLSTLLSDFDASYVELVVKCKEETELDEPTEDEDSDEE